MKRSLVAGLFALLACHAAAEEAAWAPSTFTLSNGMDVVDAIAADAQPTDGNGTIPADQQPVIESVKVLD